MASETTTHNTNSLPDSLDEIQESVVNSLEKLRRQIEETCREKQFYLSVLNLKLVRQFFLPSRRKNSRSPHELIRGFYIHGGVGRGKTMIMDNFYSSLFECSNKKRFHYHDFMRLVHDVFNNKRDKTESDTKAIASLIDEIIGDDCILLCLDEVDVIDITDAMILLRLFEAIVRRQIILVMTSNRSLQELYKDGINREKFIPFIVLMGDYLEQINMGTEGDYRQDISGDKFFWFYGKTSDNYQRLSRVYSSWSGGKAQERWIYFSGGRGILSHRRSGAKVWFSFEKLCGDTLGARDYLEISHQFRRVIIEDIPCVKEMTLDRLRRFVLLIDIFYDKRIILAVSSPCEFRVEVLDGGEKHGLPRALSRLQEMLSALYVENSEKMIL